MHAEPQLAAAASLPPDLDYITAVARLPLWGSRPLSLRLHIPSFSAEADPAGALENYLGYLKREATMHAVLFAGMCTVRQLCFDGAAPGSLPERQFDALLGHLRRHFRFMEGEAADHEAALDAGSMAAGRLARLRMQGFSRLRLDFDGGARAQERLAAQVDGARTAGFRSVCVALAFGQPGQEFWQLRRVLDTVLAAAPDRIRICHRPGAGRDEDDIVAGGVAQRMQQLCTDHLDMAAYTFTGAGQYARLPADTGEAPRQPAERRSRGIALLYPGAQLVGCGPGARTAFGAIACRNLRSLYDYYARLDRNQLPVSPLFADSRLSRI